MTCHEKHGVGKKSLDLKGLRFGNPFHNSLYFYRFKLIGRNVDKAPFQVLLCRQNLFI
jgi:hypothetical protein